MLRLVTLPAAALALAACTGRSSPPDVAAMLRTSLTGRDLSVRSVVCVPRPERIEQAPVYRCNVNFGDPHVEIYCAAVVDGALRSAAWRQAVRGVLDRQARAKECARRLSRAP
jgi:hypothetical protein